MTKDTLELDTGLVMESLKYTRRVFQGYSSYPSEEFRKQQVARVDRAIAQIRAIRDANKMRSK